MASNIAIQITANTQQAVAGIQSVNQKLDQMQKASESVSAKFQRLTSIIGGATISFGAVAKAFQTVASAASACTTAYSAQELAERKLQTTLKATQSAVGMTAGELLDLADALSSVTTYSDQEILAVEQMLAATRQIGAEVMPEATQAVLDMAAATGEDATNAAQRLAQALSDPAGEIESLKEAGIQLTEEQKKNIQKVQEQNGVYEAQKLILREVAGTYGGMAQSIADTDTGKLQQIGNVWRDIKEGLGEGLLNAIGPALDDLYGKLLAIDEWIARHNEKSKADDVAFDYLRSYIAGDSVPALSSLSDLELRSILSRSNYNTWLQGDRDTYGAPSSAIDYLRFNSRVRNATGQDFSSKDMELALAVYDELSSRRRDRISAVASTLSVPMVGSYQGIDLFGSFGMIGKAMETVNESFSESRKATERLNDFLSSNGSLSPAYQSSQIDKSIAQTQSFMEQFSDDEDVVKVLNEINDALQKQKELLETNTQAADDWVKVWLENRDDVMEVVSSSYSFLDSLVSGIKSFAEAAADALDEVSEKWDDYFENLDRKQSDSRESLNALLASGNISYEEYIDSMNELDETREEAEKERADEEEEARKKANELGRAAFEADKANQIAQATANAALAITNIWASHAANVPLASALTALSAATTGIQIATIASQEYTPLAAGGIVTAPTTALIGEGGSPEAILPLNEGNMDRFGLGGNPSGTITVNISIGTVYSKEDLAEEIFRGIERAQRTGALPSWRYA